VKTQSGIWQVSCTVIRRAASGGDLAPEPPRATHTRHQPESIWMIICFSFFLFCGLPTFFPSFPEIPRNIRFCHQISATRLFRLFRPLARGPHRRAVEIWETTKSDVQQASCGGFWENWGKRLADYKKTQNWKKNLYELWRAESGGKRKLKHINLPRARNPLPAIWVVS